ncbi:hypothetical protein [Arthrobacter sp. TMS2-4]
MDGNDQGERAAMVERLGATARADAADSAKGHQELEYALTFLGELDLRTLRELENELARPDSMISTPRPGWGTVGLAAFLGRHYAAAVPASRYHPRTPVPVLRNDVLDTLVFREIRIAHGDTMFDRCVRGVKDALGLPADASLAESGFLEYGVENVFLLLDIAASLAPVQLHRTSAHITPSMGYSGIDAYADALDACHFMSARLAAYLLRRRPSSEKFVVLAARGRLNTFGISPTDIDSTRLRTELVKLRHTLPAISAPFASWGPVDGDGRRRPPESAGKKDEARSAFVVSRFSGAPRTAGEEFEQRLTRRGWAMRTRGHRTALTAGGAVVGVMFFWSSAVVASQGAAFSAVVLAALLGMTAAIALALLLDARAEAFFRSARAMSNHTVLQGRRDAQFLAALRQVRPDMFTRSRHAGLPRLVTWVAERDGVVLLGAGTRPRTAAAFHWMHIRRITAPDEPSTTGGRSAHRVAFVVRRDDQEVVLGFPLERAKVSWTSHSYLTNQPLEAVLALLQGLHLLEAHRLVGAPKDGIGGGARGPAGLMAGAEEDGGASPELEAIDWEFRARPPLTLPDATAAQREQILLGVVIVLALIGCLLAPFLVSPALG